MKNLKTFALAAISLLGFAACQQVEITPDVKPEATHTVTFVAGAPETKTTVDIRDGENAIFAWTADDEKDRIAIYENKEAANTIVCGLDAGKMTIMASFDGPTPEAPSYLAVVNKSNITQVMSSEAYDEEADILVSKEVSEFDGENGVQLQFKREVAIAKMTLKGLDAGEVVNQITVSSTADIAGGYGVEGWTAPKKSLDITSALYLEGKGYSIVADESGNAVVWFTCMPQDATTLTVKVVADDGDTYTKEFSRAISLSRGDVNVFGVAMTKDAKDLTFDFVTHPSGWKTSSSATNNIGTYYYSLNGTDFSFTSDGDIYCGGNSVTSGYLMIKSGYHLGLPSISGYRLAKVIGTLNDSGSPSTKSSVSITDSDSNTVEGGDAQIWNSKGASFTYTLLNTDENAVYYLSPASANLQMIKLVLTYEPAKARTVLSTPENLAVSEAKVVSWDAVANAGSYTLTIGSKEISCATNSYNAKDIADEYYDVAVVAVPSDTENYKNSEAATLTDEKFGTPTLDTPSLNKGAIDEFSVNATWTVDPRATEGYNCELYNGETKVGESKTVKDGSVTFNGLNDGVTYTLKVNAIAVEGKKAYAASAVASTELTTKGTTKISEISATGTYTVKNAVVYAIPNSYTAIISDGTGMMLLNDDNKHGFSVGAQLLTIAGTVEVTNGIYQFKNPSSTKASEDLVTPDYGEPVEASAEYLASKPNKIIYVHLKGSQSGRNISVGSGSSIQKLYLNATYSSTDNKDIEAYGFIYGYNETHSTTNFIATSITEDPTVPKLSVSPTSKTWANDETNAEVFTVTTNTEGEKDWSVTPTTLDWAEIDVDKAAGTITVTPKDANTTEKAREATITVSHAAGTLSETITLIQKSTSSTSAKEYTLTITTDSFNTTSYEANNNDKTTKAVAEDGSTIDVTWCSNQIMLKSSAMQWQKSKGYLYNKTDLGEIISVTVKSTSGTFTTYYGSAPQPTSGTTVGGGYFNVKVGSATGKTTSVVVVFKK